jgi:hypothetical protein
MAGSPHDTYDDTDDTADDTADTADMLRALADRAALADLLSTFSVAIDSCDWPRYRSLFTEEIDLDYSSWRAGSIGRWSADDWVARAASLFPGFTATRHALTKVLVSLDPDTPDRARVRADVSADHVIVDEAGVAAVFTLNGYYDDRCVRTADGWRIAGKRLVVQWSTGDPTVMDDARARAGTHPQGRL